MGILFDPHLNWSSQVDCLAVKLSRASGMRAKVRHYVSTDSLRSIYYAIFSSLLHYGSLIFGQSRTKHTLRLERIQNKALRIINFADYNDPVTHLYHKSKILKFFDQVNLENSLLVYNYHKNNLPKTLRKSFHTVAETGAPTRGAAQHKMSLPPARTQNYGINSITYRSSATWNSSVSTHPDINLVSKSKPLLKEILTKNYLDSYLLL